MLHFRQVRKVKPNRHRGYREDFLQVSHTIFGKVHSSKAPKLPLETSSDRKWHRMTPSLVLGHVQECRRDFKELAYATAARSAFIFGKVASWRSPCTAEEEETQPL